MFGADRSSKSSCKYHRLFAATQNQRGGLGPINLLLHRADLVGSTGRQCGITGCFDIISVRSLAVFAPLTRTTMIAANTPAPSSSKPQRSPLPPRNSLGLLYRTRKS